MTLEEKCKKLELDLEKARTAFHDMCMYNSRHIVILNDIIGVWNSWNKCNDATYQKRMESIIERAKHMREMGYLGGPLSPL